jgi:hypothetical protein
MERKREKSEHDIFSYLVLQFDRRKIKENGHAKISSPDH